MTTRFLALLLAAAAVAPAAEAADNRFSGPRLGAEVAYEDFGSVTDGATVSAVAGWDFALGDRWVVGAQGRYAFVGVKDTQTSRTPAGLQQIADLSIRDNWGLAARAGHVLGDRVLIFGEAGYEWMRLNAIRTLKADACVPPTDCVVSRQDFSFNEGLWTLGVGAEWAVTDHVRIRAQYTYGDSDAFDRNRLALGVGWQF